MSLAGSTTLPLFTETEKAENDRLKTALMELVASGEAILFVGSGMSMSVGYPSWDQLLTQLEQLAQAIGSEFTPNQEQKEADPLAYADKIKKHFTQKGELERYFSKLHELFSPKQPNYKSIHTTLVGLPFCGIMTTNYDSVLSDALITTLSEGRSDISFAVNKQTVPELSKFLSSLNKSLSVPKRIAHLHGCYTRQNEIILTKSDYEEVYFSEKGEIGGTSAIELPNPTLHFLILWSLMATRRIVFMGFGMKDPYLITLLEAVNRKLWRWQQPTHFNISDISTTNVSDAKAKAQLLHEKFGVNTYFYENTSGDHSQLDNLVKEFHQKCFIQSNEADALQKEETTVQTVPQEVITASGSATEASSWLSEINKEMEVGLVNENQ